MRITVRIECRETVALVEGETEGDELTISDDLVNKLVAMVGSALKDIERRTIQ